MFGFLHSNLTYNRRIQVLSSHLSAQIDRGAKILDIGCGDGQISELIASQVEGSSISGIDVMQRSITNIEVSKFDGLTIPMEDNSVDTCLFVDVLHHADDSFRIMQEAARVARNTIVIKDHLADGFLSWEILRFMDWVGNERHGVALPYNYLKKAEWDNYFAELGWSLENWNTKLNIYPAWCGWAFDRELHFVAKLSLNKTASTQ